MVNDPKDEKTEENEKSERGDKPHREKDRWNRNAPESNRIGPPEPWPGPPRRDESKEEPAAFE